MIVTPAAGDASRTSADGSEGWNDARTRAEKRTAFGSDEGKAWSVDHSISARPIGVDREAKTGFSADRSPVTTSSGAGYKNATRRFRDETEFQFRKVG